MFPLNRLVFIAPLTWMCCNFGHGRAAAPLKPLTPSLRPEIALQNEHNGGINAVAFSPDGRIVASGSQDHTIKLWNAHTGDEIRTLAGHTQAITALAFSSDRRTLGSVGRDKTIRLWDVESGRAVRIIGVPDHPSDRVSSLAISPDGTTLAGGTLDDTVFLWDMKTGTPKPSLAPPALTTPAIPAALAVPAPGAAAPSISRPRRPGLGQLHAVAFSPDGRLLAAAGSSHTVWLWDLAPGQLARSMPWHGGLILSLSFSPDSQMLASAGAASTDGAITIWNVQSGAVQREWNSHQRPVETVAYSPDGLTLFSGGIDGSVKLWDVATGVARSTLADSNGSVHAVAVAPDGKTFVTGGLDRLARLWDTGTGALIRTFTGQSNPIYASAFSPDGMTLASAGSSSIIRLWNMRAGRIRRVLHVPNSSVEGLAFSADGRTLASAGGDKTERLWDVTSGRQLHILRGHTSEVLCVAFSADGTLTASGSRDQTIRVWSVRTGQLLRVLPVQGFVHLVAFARDGTTLAGGSTLPGIGFVHSAAFARGGTAQTGGSTPFSAGPRTVGNSKITLWNIHTGRLQRTLESNDLALIALSYSPDGHILARCNTKGIVRLWNAQTGVLLRDFTTGVRLKTISFSPDSRLLAGGTYDHAVDLWDLSSGKALPPFLGHSHEVWSVAFSPNGQTLVSGSIDGTIRVWRVHQHKLLATMYAFTPRPDQRADTVQAIRAKPITAGSKAITAGSKAITAGSKDMPGAVQDDPDGDEYVTVTPEGFYECSAGADRYVKFRLGNDLFPAASFNKRYYRPDLVRNALAGKTLPVITKWKGPYPPVVHFIGPSADHKLAANVTSVPVQLEVTDDSQVKNLVFLVNGSRVPAKAIAGAIRPITAGSKGVPEDTPAAHTTAQQFLVPIPLRAGETKINITAVAYDDDDLQSPEAVWTLLRSAGPVGKGHLLGLCVGISHYRAPGINLGFADNDAVELARVLRQQHRLYNVADRDIRELENSNATKANIIDAMEKLTHAARADDTVMILLSGHGMLDKNRFYFVPYDMDLGRKAETAEDWEDFVQRLIRLAITGAHVIVFLDACHSGSTASSEQLLNQVEHDQAGVLVLASSSASQTSLERDDLKHGDFTAALLEAIQGNAATPGGTINAKSLAGYVEGRVPELSQQQQSPKTVRMVDYTEPILTKVGR